MEPEGLLRVSASLKRVRRGLSESEDLRDI